MSLSGKNTEAMRREETTALREYDEFSQNLT